MTEVVRDRQYLRNLVKIAYLSSTLARNESHLYLYGSDHQICIELVLYVRSVQI
jgi:hypothetical protein